MTLQPALSLLCRQLGRYFEALPLYKRVAEGLQRTLGPEHETSLHAMAGMTGCLEAMGEYKQALQLYTRLQETAVRGELGCVCIWPGAVSLSLHPAIHPSSVLYMHHLPCAACSAGTSTPNVRQVLNQCG